MLLLCMRQAWVSPEGPSVRNTSPAEKPVLVTVRLVLTWRAAFRLPALKSPIPIPVTPFGFGVV